MEIKYRSKYSKTKKDIDSGVFTLMNAKCIILILRFSLILALIILLTLKLNWLMIHQTARLINYINSDQIDLNVRLLMTIM